MSDVRYAPGSHWPTEDSDSLDDKLRNILVQVVFSHDNDVQIYNQYVEQIKRVFAEEGYMTGQQWYNRLTAELANGLLLRHDKETGQ